MALGIELERGRPGYPQDNAAHERMHRDVSLELEALSRGDQASLDLCRQEYNEPPPRAGHALSQRSVSKEQTPLGAGHATAVRQDGQPQSQKQRSNQLE